MTIAYFDCFAGISGDMILGALIDAGADRTVLDSTVGVLGLRDEVTIDVRREHRGHVGGTRVAVTAEQHAPRSVSVLRDVVERAEIPVEVKQRAVRAIDLLSTVEAELHDEDATSIHLHELSGADTLIDLVGAFWLLRSLSIGQVYASSLPAPRGRMGLMPLPAPASVRVLAGRGAVFEATEESVELVTPTGAVVLAVAADFRRPAIKLSSIGYGIGARPTPGNALAVWVGEEVGAETGVTMIETNIDDMAPNLLGALSEDLFVAGALDVTITPSLMKKGRPGHLLAVTAKPEDVAGLTDFLLRHSTTLGVRLAPVERIIAARRIQEVKTVLGTARVKVKELGGTPVEVAPEYEDCRQLAKEHGLDLREVMRVVGEAARKELGLN